MNLVIEGVKHLACVPAGILAETLCDEIAVANVEDGVGEVLALICVALPTAFEIGCERSLTAGTENWTDNVKEEACKHLCDKN